MNSIVDIDARQYTVALREPADLPVAEKIKLEMKLIRALEAELGGAQAVADALAVFMDAQQRTAPVQNALQARWLGAVERAAESALGGAQYSTMPRFEVRRA